MIDGGLLSCAPSCCRRYWPVARHRYPVGTCSIVAGHGAPSASNIRDMAETETKAAVLTARVVAAFIAALIVLGLIWYGASAEVHQRIWSDIFERPSGPVAFRFVLQPVMASTFAIRDGIKDAHLGRSPYLWTVLTDRERYGPRLREGLIATGRVIALGLIMDTIYQLRVFGTFYPGEAAIVALLLAFAPYLLIRGPAARIARRWNRPSSGAAH
jgi:hypothetical protein